MMKPFIFILLCSFFSIYGNEGLENYGLALDMVPLAPENVELLKELDAKMADELKKPKSEKFFNKTRKGKLIKQRYDRVRNYLLINKVFENCIKDPKAKRNLGVRILEAGALSDLDNVECFSALKSFGSLEEHFSGLSDISSLLVAADLQDMIAKKALTNAISTFVNLKYQFTKGPVDNEAAAKSFCKDMMSYCKKGSLKEIEGIIKSEITEIEKAKPRKYKSAEMVKELNEKIARVNTKLKEFEKSVKVDEGSINIPFWDSSDPDFDEAAFSKYESYVSQYLKEAGQGLGLFLMTDHMREKVGGLKDKEDDINEVSDSKKNTTSYNYTEHQKVEPKDIDMAVEEAQEKIHDQVNSLLKMSKNKIDENTFKDDPLYERQRIKDLKKLTSTNPAAVGQLLINNPEYAPFICNIINRINKSDETSKVVDDVFMWGGLIVGGVLLAGGITAGVGAWVLGASGAAWASTAAGLGVAGMVLGATESAYFSHKALTSYANQKQFQASFIAGGGDARTIEDSRKELKKYDEAKVEAAIALAFTAVDAAGMVGALKLFKRSEDLKNIEKSDKLLEEKNKALSKVSSFLSQVVNNPRLLRITKKLKKLLGTEQFSKMMAALSQLSPKARLHILKKLEKWNPKSSNIDAAMEEAIEEALKLKLIDAEEAESMRSILSDKLDKATTNEQAPLPEVKLTASPSEVESIRGDLEFNQILNVYKDDEQLVAIEILSELKRQNPKLSSKEITERYHKNVGTCKVE